MERGKRIKAGVVKSTFAHRERQHRSTGAGHQGVSRITHALQRAIRYQTNKLTVNESNAKIFTSPKRLIPYVKVAPARAKLAVR